MHIPAGFAVVTPYIFVDGANEYIDFLTTAFGAREIGRSSDPTGRIANCQMMFDTSVIMLSEASEQFPASSVSLYLYVADADSAIARAIAAGGESIMAVADMPYGDRQGGIRDPRGILWWVSQRMTDAPYF